MLYLLPPEGFCSLSFLEHDVITRIKFLVQVFNSKGEPSAIRKRFQDFPNLCSNLDSLIERSKRDCASHFIIRLAISTVGHFQAYWVNAEVELFLYRLRCGGEDFIRTVINCLFSDLRKVQFTYHLPCQFQNVLDHIFSTEFYLRDSCLITCQDRWNCSHFINAPWTIVQDLVADRKVTLLEGIATIPCFLLHDLLASIFKELLYIGLEQVSSLSIQIEDDRISHLLKKIYLEFYKLTGCKNFSHTRNKILTHRDVAESVLKFPLCMQRLHIQLNQDNRLSHVERYRYTLFLKDIGLPLEENIFFWKSYYSQAPSCSQSRCQHSWTGSAAKRYEYSIRHMYGFEGKKVSYRSHSCSSLQDCRPQPTELGGCPFQYSKRTELFNILSQKSNIWPAQMKCIVKAAEDGNPSLACGLFLAAQTHNHIIKRTKFSRISSCSSILSVPNKKIYLTFKRTKSVNDVFNNRFSSSLSLTNEDNLEHRYIKDIDGTSRHMTTSRSYSQIGTCLDCNFDSINPEMSFLSPKDYFSINSNTQ